MKKKKTLFFAICIIMCFSIVVYVKRNSVKEIKCSQTYSITSKEGSVSFINFIDQENYVSINNNLSEEESKHGLYRINFVKGKYFKEKDKILLGTVFKRTTLEFYGKKSFDTKKYTVIYYSEKPAVYDFESGDIKKENTSWVYRRKDRDKKVKYSLEQSNKKIPSSSNDFLKGFSVKKNNVPEIKYGETYTFLQDEKSYIKFLDEENYVAMPGMRSIKESLGYGGSYDILYFEGKYSFNEDKYYLGKQLQVTRLSFYDEKNIDNHKYDDISQSNIQNPKDFGEGTLQRINESWVYHRIIKDDRMADYPLRKSDKYIPESTEEFLSNYEENESKNKSF